MQGKVAIHSDLLAGQCSQGECSVAVNSYIQPNQLVLWEADPLRTGQIYNKFEVTKIMPLLICINGLTSPGFRFWNFARGSDEYKPA